MAPSSACWHPGGTRTRLLSSPLPPGPPWSQRAVRESWWQGGPSGLVMRLPVEPGCGLLRLEMCRVRVGVRTSRKGDSMLAAPSDSSSADTALSAWAAGAGPSPGPSGHFAQNGHGQTLRDLELCRMESQHQDRDAGRLLSEAGGFDRQSWRGPATTLFSLAGRHAGDSSLLVSSWTDSMACSRRSALPRLQQFHS